MDHVANILGIVLPPVKARAAVMKSFRRDQTSISTIATFCRQDSMEMVFKPYRRSDSKDDDTASTISTSESDLDDSFTLSGSPRVSFAEPLVTMVRTRPYTTIREKNCLFYCDYDYAEFRREAHGYERERSRVVKFAVEETVHIIPDVTDKSVLYYSSRDLQRFLEEFIASLGSSFSME